MIADDRREASPQQWINFSFKRHVKEKRLFFAFSSYSYNFAWHSSTYFAAHQTFFNMTSFKTFSQLHHNPTPLLLGNIWDVHSAQLFEQAGYKAIGTSSQAVARSMGFEDGENLPFDLLLQIVKRVTKVVSIPFTVDIEGGYSRSAEDIIENIKALYDAGVVGINLEDTVPGATRQLLPVDEFRKILSAVAEGLSKNNMEVFLNVRTDGFLLGMPSALAVTLERIKGYEDAGAHGIFVPCITAREDIRQVVNATHLPINVMCMPELPNFNELGALGVKRISMGPFVSTLINKKATEAITTVLKDNNFSSLFK
jgi:2-methylisocitrate lyase-like PEP mutase family enzyme